MDDDIDIEEHDLMDNPRIKCIFPDLSCVKIEIPDEDYVNEQCDATAVPKEEPQEMQYQYEYSFETTENAQDEDNMQYNEENTSYFYNNEIILGSKPPTDPDVLYQEALHSHPIVYLENWEEKLKNSPCFCESCEILFPTVNALDAHKMISHSYLVAMEIPQRNTARKSTVTSKYCNHCSKTFPDDTSLIKHLYELLPLNNFPKEEDIPKPEIRKVPIVWPKKVKTESFVPKVQRKIELEPDEDFKNEEIKPKFKEKMSRDGKFFVASSLVPKSTLFQCNVCQIAFLSCFSALQHSKSCEKLLSFEKCRSCKRKIRTKDVKIHELQHNYNDKLKIYTMNKTIYERVLCKCPKCSACFDELGFWAHYQKCKKWEKKAIYCSDCDVYIAASRYKGHRQKHSTKKLSKKDFIIIEFYDETRAQQIKERVKKCKERKMHLKAKDENAVALYYCDLCGCCQYILNYKGHMDGSCKDNYCKKYCQKCGLCFTYKSYESHRILHQKRNFSLKDVQLYSLATGKIIEPPSPKYYECEICAKNFLSRRPMLLHNCKTEKSLTCKVCSKKFNIQAYKIHKIFHSADKLILNELIKKYSLIKTMWDIMYICASCDLVTMTYDAAVTHSQGHLNYIISDLHKQCLVCDLKIAEKEFLLHEKLHSNNECIERESFKILSYNYQDLFKKEWLMLFKELPKEHRNQILSKSIYRFTRSVKMQIEISAPSDDTKYFCMNCNIFVEGTCIKQHIRSNCARNTKLVCQKCHEVFKSLKQLLSHEGSHESSSNRHTIVSFNNECDKEFNNHLSLIESKTRSSSKDVPLSKLRELLLSDNRVRATHRLYKCAKCKTCVTLQSSARRHKCVTDSGKRLCEICQQYFSSKKVHLHLEAHRKKPSLTKNSFHIIYFNNEDRAKKLVKKVTARVTPKKEVAKLSPKKEVSPKITPKNIVAKVSPKKTVIAKIYECKCGLHLTSMKTVEKHLDECSPNLDVSKETCSKCNLVFPTDVLVTHLINHHHKETKIVVQKIQKVPLFKCILCDNIFTDIANFNSHTSYCDPKNGTYCKDCRFKYDRRNFPKHLCTSQDVTYVHKVTTLKKTVKQTTVYRCAKCDITYLRRNSFRYHYFEINHALKKPPTPCEICGLKFTNCSHKKHIKFHSCKNYDYKITVLDPISGRHHYLTGNNGKEESNDGNTKSPRKRRAERAEEYSAKKAKEEDPIDFSKNLAARRTSRKILEAAKLNETEIIVPDLVTNHTDTITDFDESVNNLSDSVHLSDSVTNLSDTDFDGSETDKNDSTTDPLGLSSKMKSRIMVKGYSKKLYSCEACKQHFMKEASFVYHIRNHRKEENNENYKCDVCDLEFSKYTLPRHKYVHHEHMGLTKDDFVIMTASSFPKESVITQFIIDLKHKTAKHDVSEPKLSDDNAEVSEKLSESDKVSDDSAAKLSDVNLSDMCDKVSEDDSKELSEDSITELGDSVSELTDNISENDKICYFKCSDCNVCFLDSKTCSEHTLKHEILDPKMYIQCKICDFQFLIDSLKDHVDLHHNNDFCIENLTIHEYKPLGVNLDPKVEIYQAIDKVQSRLVSTTTDVGIV